jgi:hypothetical protein
MTVISREELRAIKVALTDDRPYVDRISFALAVRLFEMRSSLREQALVIDELDVLEGLRPRLHTKAAEQFKHVPLHPLWHKHLAVMRIKDYPRDPTGPLGHHSILPTGERETQRICADDPSASVCQR